MVSGSNFLTDIPETPDSTSNAYGPNLQELCRNISLQGKDLMKYECSKRMLSVYICRLLFSHPYFSFGGLACGWTLSLTTTCQHSTTSCCLCTAKVEMSFGFLCWKKHMPSMQHMSTHEAVVFFVFPLEAKKTRQNFNS